MKLQWHWLFDPDDRRVENVAQIIIGATIATIIAILVLSSGCSTYDDGLHRYKRDFDYVRMPAPSEVSYHKQFDAYLARAWMDENRIRWGVVIGEDAVEQSEIRRVVKALALVESTNNPNAVGDGGRAVGVYQMWPIMVREANRISGKKFTNADRLDPLKSAEMCEIVLTHYSKAHGIENPVELGARWRNPNGAYAGWYMRKVQKALDEI